MDTKRRTYHPSKAAWAAARADECREQAAELARRARETSDWQTRRGLEAAELQLISEGCRFARLADRLTRRRA